MFAYDASNSRFGWSEERLSSALTKSAVFTTASEASKCFSRRAVLSAGALLATGLSGCSRRVDQTVRLKLLFEVETPQGKSFPSGVWQFDATEVPAMPGSRINRYLIGQAIPVLIEDGQSVFAMTVWNGIGLPNPTISSLYEWDGVHVLGRVSDIDISWVDRSSPGVEAAKSRAPTELVTVPPDLFPAFAMFTNPADPASGRLVKPEAIFTAKGDPVSVKLKIQIVHEPPTTGIEAHLPWLREKRGRNSRDLGSDSFASHPDYFLGWTR